MRRTGVLAMVAVVVVVGCAGCSPATRPPAPLPPAALARFPGDAFVRSAWVSRPSLPDASLPAGAGAIGGQVRDRELAPVAGLEVVVKNDGGEIVAHATTSADGGYDVRPLPPGRYKVDILQGKNDWRYTAHVEAGKVAPLRVYIDTSSGAQHVNQLDGMGETSSH
jgi:hypothetical protein